MKLSKHRKTLFDVEKISTFEIQRKKSKPFKLFEFLKRFVIGAFLIAFTQLEKNRSINKIFIPLDI